jgi:hypothetical protein
MSIETMKIILTVAILIGIYKGLFGENNVLFY